MWIKMLGIICIISGFGAWGLIGGRTLDKRVAQIKEIRMALGFLEKEISCMYIPLPRALERTARFCKKPTAILFAESSRKLQSREGATANEAWSHGLNELRRDSDLKEKDLELLAAAASQLGMSDVMQQKKIFNLLQEELAILEAKAWQDAQAGRKLWNYGGFMIGALIVILLL
ncbi:MAG: hypothetical protein PHC92_06360 [Syntrophomonadaceae bacterium]|nr:hypothetical protein [Syntrophomonadaceae bacterium]MDD3024385.1 hypothetical protein [Syntrophomonadaceae bacterium]